MGEELDILPWYGPAGITYDGMVGFRVSVTDVNGPSEWSQVVTVLVH